MFRTIFAAFGALMLILTLAACTTTAAEPVTVSEQAIIVDVRTPEEYAAGHLEGAQLLDLNGGQLAETLPTLDPAAEYFVYCRSGSRSGQATAMMKDAGFENVTDLGSLTRAAEATRLPIVG